VNSRKNTLSLMGVPGKAPYNGDATRLLLKDCELQNYVWNKLYNARLWEGVRFPVGQNTKISTPPKRLSKRPAGSYCCQKPELLSRSADGHRPGALPFKIRWTAPSRALERYDALKDKYPECRNVMSYGIMHTLTKVWSLAWLNRELAEGVYSEK
jgi:hypothetical protein